MLWFPPYPKHPWKTKVDGARPVTGTVISRQHMLTRWCLLTPHRVSTLLSGATQRGFTASLQAKNRKHKCTSWLLVCVCVSHRMLVNCGMCKMLQWVLKAMVKFFKINVVHLCTGSVGFAVKMCKDY